MTEDDRHHCESFHQLATLVGDLSDLMATNRLKESELMERVCGLLVTHNAELARTFVHAFIAEKEAELSKSGAGQSSRKGDEKKRPTKQPSGCSFCGKFQTEVKRMVAGPNALICDECVLKCMELIQSPKDEDSAS